MKILLFFLISLNVDAANFTTAKNYLSKNLELFDSKTIYCGCRVMGNKIDLKSCNYKIQKNKQRAERLEWEHVVPAEAFGQSFPEWRVGSSACGKKKGKIIKGRKCAQKNPKYVEMEGDLYNLYPSIGELNGLRSNLSMAALTSSKYDFGGCKARIDDRKFEPMDFAKGVVARTYMNFEARYPGRGVISNKNRKLFLAWDKMYPVTELECKRWKALEENAGYKHLLVGRCG